jgi:PRTRC genetic system protein C
MMKTQTVERIFEFNHRHFPDPDPSLEPAEVKELLATGDPELTSAAIEGPELKDGKAHYRFVRQVGTKG